MAQTIHDVEVAVVTVERNVLSKQTNKQKID
jgi:hypothetical protein